MQGIFLAKLLTVNVQVRAIEVYIQPVRVSSTWTRTHLSVMVDTGARNRRNRLVLYDGRRIGTARTTSIIPHLKAYYLTRTTTGNGKANH